MIVYVPQPFLFLLSVLMFSLKNVYGCVTPSGLGTGAGELDPDSLNLPVGEVFQGFVDGIDRFVIDYETPIQFRLIELISAVIWNGVSSYEETVLDRFGRITESELRRRCQNVINNDLFLLHRRITLAYCWYYSVTTFLPATFDTATNLINSWNLSETICDTNSTSGFDCSDTSTPWGLAFTANEEVKQWSQYDGWNADGSLLRDFNRIPYSDFRDGNDRYVPVNSPWKVSVVDRWQPLLESDNLGFLRYQEHVTPHIGFTGKSWFFTDDEICEFSVDEPNYDYLNEINLLFNRMNNLTDETKMLVEYFDFKPTSIAALNGQFWKRQGISLDDWDFIKPNFFVNNLLYEATMIVWKEKITFDKIRPPSIIHYLLDGQEITTYAGTTMSGLSFGTQTFVANDFEPYIRTMPHSEYPSASACLCEAYAQMMRNIVGTDDITSILFSPLFESFFPFSSQVEPLSTPQNFILKTFSTFTQISQECGKSRLDGGMHFSKSVPNGQNLCRGLSDILFNRFTQLINGIVPDNIADVNDVSILKRECSESQDSSDRSDSSDSSDSS